MKIVALEAENIKHLKVVNIRPDGSLIVVGGDNAAGKSSLLDSIEYALGGASSVPTKPIRDGQKKARVVLDLGDIQVIRTFTEKGTNLTVKNKDGTTFASPQTMLDKLVGELAFDPLEFSKMDAGRQAVVLKKLVGLDFDSLDAEHKKLFEERTVVNRQGKAAKASLDKIKRHENVPDEEKSIGKLIKACSDAIDHNRKISLVRDELDADLAELKTIESRKAVLLKNIAEKQKALDGCKPIDEEAMQKTISEAEITNLKVRDNKAFDQMDREVIALRKRSMDLTDKMSKISETRNKGLAKANFPIEGLDLDKDGVTFDDLPFVQCSSAQKIKISVAMGLAMNPKLRILLIREGSLLDKKNLAMVAQMAEEADAQIWLERVSKGSECSLIIEDGSVLQKEKVGA